MGGGNNEIGKTGTGPGFPSIWMPVWYANALEDEAAYQRRKKFQRRDLKRLGRIRKGVGR
jgi:hypothetical protein